ncbi:MAG: hypothetical protein J0L57_21035 [Burkholderiales bacterium]|nr:hypothetical protein [Burkholderiales bacterium]
MKTYPGIAATSVALLLAACGGDDGGPPATPQAMSELPQSALASAEAFSRFVGALPPSDTGEALELKDAQPPASETDEPVPVG